jgi:ABC-type dipeptide/oligopeptide/nickel transport system permease component
MLKVIRQRLIDFIPVLLAMSVVVFGLLYMLPGDPAKAMIAGSGAPAELIDQLRTQMGLDQPVYVQYWRFVSRAATGNLGRSLTSQKLVTAMIWDVAPQTIELTFSSILLAIVLGVPLGMLAAVYRNTWIDRLVMLISIAGVSMPQFWLGLLLILLFSFRLGWVPATGVGGLPRLILPTVVLGYGAASVFARMVRGAMLEVLGQEYVIAARGKGVSAFRVITHHAFRNAVIPVITVISLQIGWLLGGAVIVEAVFSRPGVGRLLVDAITAKDFPVVQGVILFITVAYLVINLIADLLYGALDPRVRQ